MPAQRSGDAPAEASPKRGVGQGQSQHGHDPTGRPRSCHHAVPGHWEGDLMLGKKMTSIGTLVKRYTATI